MQTISVKDRLFAAYTSIETAAKELKDAETAFEIATKALEEAKRVYVDRRAGWDLVVALCTPGPKKKDGGRPPALPVSGPGR